MTEFIGARISLISKSNIRYVGTLHEINSETSTVALEQVVSHGTEGRRGGDGEIAGSENVYEYIVFRGSDVKDLRIEEPAQKKPPIPPPQLDDPAILGQSSRPYAPPQPPPGQFQQQQAPPPMGMPPYYQFPPPQQQHRGYGPGPSPYQAAGMFGAYPPPMGGQSPMGMPGPGLAGPQQQPPQQQPHPLQPPHQQPHQAPQQPMQQQQPPQPNQQQPPTGPQNRAPPQAPIGPSANRQVPGASRQPPAQAPKPQEQPAQPTAAPVQQQPKGENTNQPKLSEQTNAGAPVAAAPHNPATAPSGPKARGGIVPALPRTSPAARPSTTTTANNAAASPAQLPPKPEAAASANATSAAVRDLADKVNRLAVTAGNAAAAPKPTATTNSNTNNANHTNSPRAVDGPVPNVPAPGVQVTHHQARTRQQPGTGNFVAGRGRGSLRGNFNQQTRKVEVPTTDFDFQGNNEKFNKQDLVKEAIASGTDENAPHVTEPASSTEEQSANTDEAAVSIPPPPKDGFYNKKSSFFDNISCENKERAEAVPGERRGGAQFRSEEQKKNLETFGQGSVDGYGSGYRGGWRGGRGRARGGYRGRGFGYSRGGSGTGGGYRAQQQQAGTAAGN
ncbi:putative G2/M phase checkpoint control protein Sum2 [Tricharina praecox]|uniref:putative G2/M phase checkpoint control protein Sum2 n=1 Tax=Tricharina praecox TaxID=43433 RepID=UPI00221FEB75|nr:putative G2/M phase checkpoint control protein Sum2 [Tricharina praecox]KAI5852134.1 putative G2/M phase checkpoint control protein Sum2 [Tricharina praecox]